MDKQVQFFGATKEGIFCQPLFGSSGTFEKVAGAPPFADWATGDELRKFISRITPQQRKDNAYLLLNALGAGEFFGSNINADYFPWNALAHKGDDYGHDTFLNGHAFQHHVNKDPTRAFGKPVLSLLNPTMKRVELIVELNRAKAKSEGADGIITRVDAGEFPDVSMGCRVPFDVCSICEHRSKTRNDYCEHMSPPPELTGVYGPNKILPDGRKIYVVNLYPKFFDISFVFIGADKTAKVMAKLASSKTLVCLGDICTTPLPSAQVAELVDQYGNPVSSESAMSKVASVQEEVPCEACLIIKEAFSTKESEQKKLSEIIKEVPAGPFAIRNLPALESSEPRIPSDTLDSLSSTPLPSILSGTLGMGMVLRPEEFQRIILKKMGEDDLLQDLESKNQVFKEPSSTTPMDIQDSEDMASSIKLLLPMLKNLIGTRTAFGPSFKLRVVVVKPSHNSLPTPERVEHPLLDKIGSAYVGYRRAALMKISQATQVMESDPQLREAILGDGLVNLFSKNASNEPVVSLDSVAYFMGAYLEDRGLGNSKAVAEKFAAANPQLLVEGRSAQRF